MEDKDLKEAAENETETSDNENMAELNDKADKFDAISEDYEVLRQIAADNGKSVTEFLCALRNKRTSERKNTLVSECGGNEEMADYILGLEKTDKDIGFAELQKEFPDIKSIDELPKQVTENVKLKGTLLLDEYLRYRHNTQKAARKVVNQGELAADASIGSQTDRKGGINPETSEFLKGLWDFRG